MPKPAPKPLSPEAKKAKKVFKRALKEARPAPRELPKDLKGVAGITMLNDVDVPPAQEIPHDPEIESSWKVIRRDSEVTIDLPQMSDEVEHQLFKFAAVIADARVAVRRNRKGSAYMIGQIRAEMRDTNMITERFLISLQQSTSKTLNPKKAKA
jgi:hypothetical protein